MCIYICFGGCLWKLFNWCDLSSRLDKVLGSVGSYSGLGKLRNDDDFIDRLSHHYTTMLLVIFTIIVSTKQYVGDSIQCWCPAQFTEAHVHYTNQVCCRKFCTFTSLCTNPAQLSEANAHYASHVCCLKFCM